MSLKFMRWLHQRGFSRKKMRGGRLHRWFGDHLFNRHLWRLEREGVARAMFLGNLSALSPFFGFHLIIGCSLAIFFRANIPVTAALQFITNPATILFYYPFAYLLGARLMGQQGIQAEEFRELIVSQSHGKIWLALQEIGLPLLLGCTVCGVVFGSCCWALVQILWPRHAQRSKSAHQPPGPTDRPYA